MKKIKNTSEKTYALMTLGHPNHFNRYSISRNSKLLCWADTEYDYDDETYNEYFAIIELNGAHSYIRQSMNYDLVYNENTWDGCIAKSLFELEEQMKQLPYYNALLPMIREYKLRQLLGH